MGRGYEKKFYDGLANDTSISAAGTFVDWTADGPTADTSSMVDIVQGVKENQRIGRKCTITNIHARLNFEFLTNETASMVNADIAHETIRCMIVWDKQSNGANLGNGDKLLQGNLYNSFRELNNIKKFKVLYDKLVTFNTTAIAAADATTSFIITQVSRLVVRDYQLKVSIKCFIPIEYTATLGAITELSTNNIAMIIWSKHGARMKLTSSPVRFRFIDF